MPLELETILKDFECKDEAELLQKRSTGKQIRAAEVIEQPRLVPMTADQCKRLCAKVKLDYVPGYEMRVIERVTTTEAPDRYGDIVRAKGANIANYKNNPVVLFAHRHEQAPVGKSIKLWQDNAIMGWRSWDLYFGNEIDSTGYHEYIFKLVSSGAMPGGSIGFIPTQTKSDHTEAEREALGIGRWGVEFLAWDYLEHSACSVPANPQALANSLRTIGTPKLSKFFSQPDLQAMGNLKILDAEMLDVFANTLGIKPVVVDMKPEEKKAEPEKGIPVGIGCARFDSSGLTEPDSIEDGLEKIIATMKAFEKKVSDKLTDSEKQAATDINKRLDRIEASLKAIEQSIAEVKAISPSPAAPASEDKGLEFGKMLFNFGKPDIR